MPQKTLIMMLALVIAAAALTIWIASLLTSSLSVSPIVGVSVLSAIALAGSFFLRVGSNRLNKSSDDQNSD